MAQVLDVAWDVDTGGSQLDVLIAEHLAHKFNSQMGAGVDVLQHPKAMAKLKKQVRGWTGSVGRTWRARRWYNAVWLLS